VGFKRVLISGCLGMLCLIPMAMLSFYAFDLVSIISGGLITNLNQALANLPGELGVFGILIGGVLGLVVILLFPIHWVIMYRGDDPIMMVAVILPWILCCAITSGIFAHSPRGGLHTSLAIGLGWMIVGIAGSLVLTVVLAEALGPLSGALDALIEGFTDLPMALAIFFSCLEGMVIGGVFGAFVGSLKYKPEGMGSSPKTKKQKTKEGKSRSSEPKIDTTPTTSKPLSSSSGGSGSCTNCGAKLQPRDGFCTNCGMKA